MQDNRIQNERYESMQAALTELQQELTEANALVQQAADALGNPLGELVHSQIRYASPPLRAAFVLSAGYALPNTETARQRRILLAAALELLHVALNIHILLINASFQSPDNGTTTTEFNPKTSSAETPHLGDSPSPSIHPQDTLDKSFIGSTILAGDYCFSRSAQFAAQTDSPLVVERFAHALQTVSEANLRRIFGAPSPNPESGPNDDHALLLAGAQAAVELNGMTVSHKTTAIELCTDFVRYLNQESDAPQLTGQITNASLHSGQTQRWMALYHWVSQTNPQLI